MTLVLFQVWHWMIVKVDNKKVNNCKTVQRYKAFCFEQNAYKIIIFATSFCQNSCWFIAQTISELTNKMLFLEIGLKSKKNRGWKENTFSYLHFFTSRHKKPQGFLICKSKYRIECLVKRYTTIKDTHNKRHSDPAAMKITSDRDQDDICPRRCLS